MRSSTFAAFLILCGFCAAWPWTVEKRVRFTSPSDPKRFKFYSTINKAGVICDSDQGPDGETLWYQDLTASVVGYINYKTGHVREFPIPWSHGSKRPVNTPSLDNVTTLQCVMRMGKDGNIYGGAGVRNEIIRINPRVDPPHIRTFAPKTHAHPAGNIQNFNDAWGANEGLYFSQTTADIVTLFEYKTHRFVDYHVRNENPIPLNSPLGMRTDAHDNLWFTNFVGQYLSKIDKKTQKVVEYPHCCLGLLPLTKGLFPEVLRSATSNLKYLWANAFGGGGYIRMDVSNPDSPKFKFFQNPVGLGTFPFENVNDFCGRIWYTSPVRNNVYYYDPKTRHWTTVHVPTEIAGIPKAGSFEVTMHRGPGHYMWFTLGTVGRIVRYELDADCKGEPA